MIFISNFIKTILLPPGCLILLLLIITLLIPRRYRIFSGFITAFLYFISIQPVADALLRPLEDSYPPLSPEVLVQNNAALDEPEAIIVLGGGIIQNSPEAGEGRDTLASDAMKRAVYAFGLSDFLEIPLVFTGGIVFDYNQEPEAVAAGRFFTFLGMPSERLILHGNQFSQESNTGINFRQSRRQPSIILDKGNFELVFCL